MFDSFDLFLGLVTDLKDVHISAVALGKAHVVALTNKGHVYSFGINNKGQCGRDFAPHPKESASESNCFVSVSICAMFLLKKFCIFFSVTVILVCVEVDKTFLWDLVFPKQILAQKLKL